MDFIQNIIGFFSPEFLGNHPDYALAIIFLIAFGEALLVIGLFVPSTVVLMGAGTLVGSGHLEFWPVFIATALGCIAGDQVSFWAGRWYGAQLKSMWPLSSYPQLLAKGEDYVKQHGGKSIAIGRFVPGVKAVVPGIVGMLHMSQSYFLTVNILSGLAWTAAHVLPGILIGKGLALAGEMSERLVVLLLALLATLAIAGWLIRVAAGGLAPYVDKVLHRLSAWMLGRKSRPLRRLGLALRPGKPRAKLLLLFAMLCLGGILVLADIVSGLLIKSAISNLDLSIQNVMAQLRSAPGDQLMIPVTLLGDNRVALIIGAALAGWLLWKRAWRQAIGVAAIVITARLGTDGLKYLVARPRPATGAIYETLGNFSFPSGHAVMAGTVFGLIGIIAGHGLARWSKALIISICSGAAIAVAFSRLYLGMHWFSDVIGGLLIALVLVTAFAIFLEGFPARRLRPAGFLLWMAAATAMVGSFQIYRGFEHAQSFYTAPNRAETHSLDEWLAGGWKTIAQRRIDLAGTPEEEFVAQWVGDLASLEAYGTKQGWRLLPHWQWKDSLHYLNDEAAFHDIPPRPLLHEGLVAKLTAITSEEPTKRGRVVLRVYHSNINLKTGSGNLPLYLLSLTRETLRSRRHLFSLPFREVAVNGPLPDIFKEVTTALPGAAVTATGGPLIIVAKGAP